MRLDAQAEATQEPVRAGRAHRAEERRWGCEDTYLPLRGTAGSDTDSTAGHSEGIASPHSEPEAERAEGLAERQPCPAGVAESQQAVKHATEAGQLLRSPSEAPLAEREAVQDMQPQRAASEPGDQGSEESREYRLKLDCQRLEHVVEELREQMQSMAEQGLQRHKSGDGDSDTDVECESKSRPSRVSGRARGSVNSRPLLDAEGDMMEECNWLYLENQRLAAERQAEAQRAEELVTELVRKHQELEEAAATFGYTCHDAENSDATPGSEMRSDSNPHRKEFQLVEETNRELQAQLEEMHAKQEAANRALAASQGQHDALQARASLLEEEINITRGHLENQLHVSEALRDEADQLQSMLTAKGRRVRTDSRYTPSSSGALSPTSSWWRRAASRNGWRSSSVDHGSAATSLATPLGQALQGQRGSRRPSRGSLLSSDAGGGALAFEVFRIDTDGRESASLSPACSVAGVDEGAAADDMLPRFLGASQSGGEDVVFSHPQPAPLDDLDENIVWGAGVSARPTMPAPVLPPREPETLETVHSFLSSVRSSESNSTSTSSLRDWRIRHRDSAPRPGVVSKLTRLFGGRRFHQQVDQQRTWAFDHQTPHDTSEDWE